MAGKKTNLFIVISISVDSVVIPDEKFRHIDPEGGYEDPDEGFRAELAAMTGQAKVSINALPTKAYLEATIVPTVMRGLHEVCHARPDNPLEFLAYYILKHNPNRKHNEEVMPSVATGGDAAEKAAQ